MDPVKEVLQASKFPKLNPVQELAIESGLLERKNLVVAAPTASGKTVVAEIAALNNFDKGFGKTIYMAPLVSLAAEKFQTFKAKYEKLGLKVAISVGDLDSSDPWLARYDVIICTTEKLDSLIRHSAEWIKSIGLIVVDEVHMLNDVGRGPTLEVTLTRIMEMVPKAQILALSATIKNAGDLAKWLKAKTVFSDWRPVKLYAGTCFDSKIKFLEKDGYKLNPETESESAIIENTLNLGKQALFFVSTRRSAESLAKKLTASVSKRISKNDSYLLKSLSSTVESVLEAPTEQCRKISSCVRCGVAFHHAGLLHKQKSLIEENFKNGLIKAIVATPTLAYGVNLPAFRVVMRDLKRYYDGIGSSFLPVLEVHQMLGRCGRPAYDKFGEGILLAKNEDEAEELTERYLLSDPEEIYSKLAVEPVLRMHTLSLIATGATLSENALLAFFAKTFYAYQYHDASLLEDRILTVLDKLVEWKFVVKDKERLAATRIGKRVAELYIDPLTAYHFVNSINKASKIETVPFSYLQTISNSREMWPLLRVRSGEFADLNESIALNENNFLQEVPEEWDLEFETFLDSVKTATMLEFWLNEATEEQMLEKYRITPGELYGKLRNADWLVYSMQELSLLLGRMEVLKAVKRVRVRMMYGIKEELLPLVKIKGIGRARARKLFNANIRSVAQLKTATLQTLSAVVGTKTANIIKEQLEKGTGIKQVSLKNSNLYDFDN